jgi:hypothetical protein
LPAATKPLLRKKRLGDFFPINQTGLPKNLSPRVPVPDAIRRREAGVCGVSPYFVLIVPGPRRFAA